MSTRPWVPACPVTVMLVLANCWTFALPFLAGDIPWGAMFSFDPGNDFPEWMQALDRMGALHPGARDDWKPDQLWRLASACYLHGNFLHLAINMFVLARLGAFFERWAGGRTLLAVYTVSGIVGSVASLAASTYASLAVGASGAVFGIAGALCARVWRHRHRLRDGFRAAAVTTIMLVVAVASPVLIELVFPDIHVDHAAHIGGTLAGFVLCALPAPRLGRAGIRLAGIALIALFALSWLMPVVRWLERPGVGLAAAPVPVRLGQLDLVLELPRGWRAAESDRARGIEGGAWRRGGAELLWSVERGSSRPGLTRFIAQLRTEWDRLAASRKILAWRERHYEDFVDKDPGGAILAVEIELTVDGIFGPRTASRLEIWRVVEGASGILFLRYDGPPDETDDAALGEGLAIVQSLRIQP